MNEDGKVDGRDVAPFIAAVQGSGVVQVVPEPAALWLTSIALLSLAARRRRVARQLPLPPPDRWHRPV